MRWTRGLLTQGNREGFIFLLSIPCALNAGKFQVGGNRRAVGRS